MSNPVLTASPIFGEPKAGRGTTITQPRPVGNAYPSTATATPLPTGTPVGFTSDGRVDAGVADRMTYDDVVIRTFGLLALIVIGGAVAWSVAPGLMYVGLIGGLVLGLVNAFKKVPSPPLIMAYAAFQGLMLGGISKIFDDAWPGVVVQAVIATIAVFAVVLIAFASGKIRATPRFTKILLIAMGGYLLYSLVNLGFMWFGGMTGFGLNSNVEIAGMPLGVVVGVFAVILAAFSFVLDFDAIKRGVDAGAPRIYAWSGAFGLTVTLIWLYVEFLRLFAILRD